MNNTDKIIEELNNISTELYNGNTNIGMAEIGLVLGEMSACAYELSDDKKEELTNALGSLLEAMEQQDAISMADIITYELIEILK